MRTLQDFLLQAVGLFDKTIRAGLLSGHAEAQEKDGVAEATLSK